MRFETEAELVERTLKSRFYRGLTNSFTLHTTLAEPKGLFGIPDLLLGGVSHEDQEPVQLRVIAFEMKLSHWNKALSQAFRYLAFSDAAYVVIDHAKLAPALANRDKFLKANIGLLSVDTFGRVFRHLESKYHRPFSEEVRLKIEKLVVEGFCAQEAVPNSMGVPSIQIQQFYRKAEWRSGLIFNPALGQKQHIGLHNLVSDLENS